MAIIGSMRHTACCQWYLAHLCITLDAQLDSL